MAKVLVIDDEPAIVRFLVRALDASGYAVLAATTAPRGCASPPSTAPTSSSSTSSCPASRASPSSPR